VAKRFVDSGGGLLFFIVFGKKARDKTAKLSSNNANATARDCDWLVNFMVKGRVRYTMAIVEREI
jgi:hypothetical protein